MTDRTPDECISKVWEIANANPDYCEPSFSTLCDQWWLVFIDCAHGKFQGESQGMCDVSTAFVGALSNFWRAHPDSGRSPEPERMGGMSAQPAPSPPCCNRCPACAAWSVQNLEGLDMRPVTRWFACGRHLNAVLREGQWEADAVQIMSL